MSGKIKWGILGAGFIANRFAEGLKVLPDAQIQAVYSSNREKGLLFSQQFDVPCLYDRIEEFANDSEIDAVYIATPNHVHLENVKACISAGKAVLCEKPMGVNAKEELSMIDYARENDVFLMEAMWTRFLPVIGHVQKWLSQGRIGKPRMININFGFRTDWNPESRWLNLGLIGGAVMDVGVYGIGLASLIFGANPEEIKSLGHLGETGVDEQTAVILKYPQGCLAALTFAVRTDTPHEAQIFGTEGAIRIPDFWRCTEAFLRRLDGAEEKVKIPFTGSGYNYEAEEVMNCLRIGRKESPAMPLHESYAIMQVIDEIRKQMGLKFPQE